MEAVLTNNKSDLVKTIIILAWFTIIYNLIEGVVSLYFGADDLSLSLFGFGADSFIEVFSAILVLWRFKKEELQVTTLSRAKEEKVTRIIANLLIVLAMGTWASCAIQLSNHAHPDSTVAGMIISILSLSFMYFLWKKKKQLGNELNSTVVLSDANCSLACIKLSAVLLLGSILYYLSPALWWVDSVAATIISFFIFQEGRNIKKALEQGNVGCGCGC